MAELKAFLPFMQTLLGSLITLLGVLVVQRGADKREWGKLQREAIQETFELLRKVESLYVKEAIVFYKGIRDSNLDILRSSEYGSEAAESSDKAIALLELYFPFLEELTAEFCETEASLVNYHSYVIDSFQEVDLDSYNQKSERFSDEIAGKISQIHAALSELMRQSLKR
ncbi:hypothetical protein [Pseudoalteromonas xiamenensis]